MTKKLIMTVFLVFNLFTSTQTKPINGSETPPPAPALTVIQVIEIQTMPVRIIGQQVTTQFVVPGPNPRIINMPITLLALKGPKYNSSQASLARARDELSAQAKIAFPDLLNRNPFDVHGATRAICHPTSIGGSNLMLIFLHTPDASQPQIQWCQTYFYDATSHRHALTKKLKIDTRGHSNDSVDQELVLRHLSANKPDPILVGARHVSTIELSALGCLSCGLFAIEGRDTPSGLRKIAAQGFTALSKRFGSEVTGANRAVCYPTQRQGAFRLGLVQALTLAETLSSLPQGPARELFISRKPPVERHTTYDYTPESGHIAPSDTMNVVLYSGTREADIRTIESDLNKQ